MALVLACTGCGPATADCAKPEVFCVGLVTETGRVDDRAFNQAAWEGIQEAEAEGAAVQIAAIETIDPRDYEENISTFAEAGYDVIVTVGDTSSTATYGSAEQYPGVYFIGADQQPPADQTALPNLVWLVFREDRLGFLAGAMAAAMTQTNKVGAVCGSSAAPAMQLYGDGFIAGAAQQNPDVNASVTYHDEVGLDETFSDPNWGAEAANVLIDEGADVIFGVGGTTGRGAISTAATRSVYVIGAEIDEYALLPEAAPRLLTSVLKLIAPGVADLIQAAEEAQSSNSPYRTGNYYGQTGMAPYHDLDALIPEKVKSEMKALVESLSSGQFPASEPAPTPPTQE